MRKRPASLYALLLAWCMPLSFGLRIRPSAGRVLTLGSVVYIMVNQGAFHIDDQEFKVCKLELEHLPLLQLLNPFLARTRI